MFRFADKKTKIILMNALVISVFRYGCPLLINSNQKLISKLQTLLMKCTRHITCLTWKEAGKADFGGARGSPCVFFLLGPRSESDSFGPTQNPGVYMSRGRRNVRKVLFTLLGWKISLFLYVMIDLDTPRSPLCGLGTPITTWFYICLVCFNTRVLQFQPAPL